MALAAGGWLTDPVTAFGALCLAAIGFVKERTGSFAISLLSIASCLALGAGIVLWERAREQRAIGLVSKVSS